MSDAEREFLEEMRECESFVRFQAETLLKRGFGRAAVIAAIKREAIVMEGLAVVEALEARNGN